MNYTLQGLTFCIYLTFKVCKSIKNGNSVTKSQKISPNSRSTIKYQIFEYGVSWVWLSHSILANKSEDMLHMSKFMLDNGTTY